MNRYVRDELIKNALDMAMIGNLIQHDMPDEVVREDAFSIKWIQDILDFWYHMVPFSSTINKQTNFNATANVDEITLPSDFILDVKNGYFVQEIPGDTKSLRKVFRLTLPKFLQWRLEYQKATNVDFPYVYTILGNKMKICPVPTVNTVGELWYYQLPPKLGARDKPNHPSDYVITEYLRLRALEFGRIEKPGTAHAYCKQIIGDMVKSGLMNEPEDNEVPLDPIKYRSINTNPFGWMGAR